MLPEALVIFSCTFNPTAYTGQSACSESSSLYFSQNPEVKKQIDKDEKMVRNYIGPSIVDTVGPALFVVAGGSGTIKLNKYFSLQFKKDEGMLTFRMNLP